MHQQMPNPMEATGRAVFSAQYAIVTTSPKEATSVSVAQLAAREAHPRVLTLGCSPRPDAVTQRFPFSELAGALANPLKDFGSYRCGFSDSTGAPAWDADTYAACIVDYGAGATRQRAVFDWQPGSYQLPPCSFVRVAVLPWGVWNGVDEVSAAAFAATVTTGLFPAGRVPVVSARVQYAAVGGGGARQFLMPRKAAAVELLPLTAGVFSMDLGLGAHTPVQRSQSGAVWLPPWSPVQIQDPVGGVYTQSDTAGSYAALQFFLSL